MTNWLESEEIRKELEEKGNAIVANEAKIRVQDLAEKEKILHETLILFYDLCNRVYKIKHSPTVSRLNIVGTSLYHLPTEHRKHIWGECNDCPPTTTHYEVTVHGFRGILFTVSESEEINIIVYYDLQKTSTYSRYSEITKTDLKNPRRTIFRKKCLLEDISNWSEEKMLNTIRWIILEFDTFEENLPGENEDLIQKKEKAELLNKQNLELELQRKTKDVDDDNLISSIGKGILWALIGLPIGFIAGGIIGFVLSMIYIVVANKNAHEGDQFMNSTMYIVVVICVIIGFFGGFLSKREKK